MDPHDSELVDELELLEAFRELRPSPAKFADEVRAQIAASSAHETSDSAAQPSPAATDDSKPRDTAPSRIAALSPFVRRAAAFLPPGFLAAPAAAKVALQGSAKGLGAKGFAGVISFPAIVIIAVVITVVTLIRKFRKLDDVEQDRSGSDSEHLQKWWAEHHKVALLVLLIANALIFYKPAVSLPLYFGLSATTVVLTLTRLQVAGFGSREVIRRRTSQLLFGLGCWMPMLLFTDVEPRYLLGPTLYLGSFLLMLPALRRNAINAQAIKVLAWLLGPFALIISLFVGFALPWSMLLQLNQPIGRADLIEYVEQFPGRTANSAEWSHWGLVAHWLTEDKAEVDLESVREGVFERISAGEKLHPQSAYIAWSQKVLEDSDLLNFLDQNPWLTRARTTTPNPGSGAALQIVHRLESDSLFVSKARSSLGTRIGQSLPSAGAFNALTDLWWITEILDLLEHRWMFELRREQLHEIIASAWLGSANSDGKPIGFFDTPSLGRPEVDDMFQSVPTWIAAALMSRCGVPEAVDLRRVIDFTIASGYKSRGREPNAYQLVLCAAKERLLRDHPEVAALALAANLERYPPRFSPNWWWWLIKARFDLIAALALVGLCFWATYRCPPESETA
ncbi:MAG: hypothetical protein ACI8TQ_001755 [Planctomycetota bacterium]|jgi:hypothetical protein